MVGTSRPRKLLVLTLLVVVGLLSSTGGWARRTGVRHPVPRGQKKPSSRHAPSPHPASRPVGSSDDVGDLAEEPEVEFEVEEEEAPKKREGLTALGGYSDSDSDGDDDDDEDNDHDTHGSSFGRVAARAPFPGKPASRDPTAQYEGEDDEGVLDDLLKDLWKARFVPSMPVDELTRIVREVKGSQQALRVTDTWEGEELVGEDPSTSSFVVPLYRLLLKELVGDQCLGPALGACGSFIDPDVALHLRGAAALAHHPRYLSHAIGLPTARARGIRLLTPGATHGMQVSLARALAHATDASFVMLGSEEVRQIAAAGASAEDGEGNAARGRPSTRRILCALLEAMEEDGGPFVVFLGNRGSGVLRSATACQRLAQELRNLSSRSLYVLSSAPDLALVRSGSVASSEKERGAEASKGLPREGRFVFMGQAPDQGQPSPGARPGQEQPQSLVVPPPHVIEHMMREAMQSLSGAVQDGQGDGKKGSKSHGGKGNPPPSFLMDLLSDALKDEEVKKSLENMVNSGQSSFSITFSSGSQDGSGEEDYNPGAHSSSSRQSSGQQQQQQQSSSPMSLPQWLASLRRSRPSSWGQQEESGDVHGESSGDVFHPSEDEDEHEKSEGEAGVTGRVRERAPSQSDAVALLSLFEDLEIPSPRDEALRRHWDRWVQADIGWHNIRRNKSALQSALHKVRLSCPTLDSSRLDPLLARHELTDEETSMVVLMALKVEAIRMQAQDPASGGGGAFAVGADGSLMVSQFSIEMAFSAVCKAHVPRPGQPNTRTREEVAQLAQNDRHEQALVTNVILPRDIGVTYDMIGGLTEAKELLRQCITYPLKFPHLYEEGIAKEAVKGVLLFGPPGTGKTMLAKAVATEGGATFLTVDASTIENKWLGESEKNARAVFTLARRLAPCVIYLDEVDSVLSSREKYDDTPHGTLTSVKTTLMQEWDGLRTTGDRVVVIASTNRPFDLDEAVLRRLPRRIMVDLPDLETREDILRVTMANNRVDPNLDYTEVARDLEGFTGSDIKEVCREAVVRIAHEHAQELEKGNGEGLDLTLRLRAVTKEDFAEARKKMTTSVSEKGRELTRVKEWNEEYGEIKKHDSRPSQHLSMYL